MSKTSLPDVAAKAAKADTKPAKKKNPVEDADERVRRSIEQSLFSLMSGNSIYGEPRTAQDVSDGTGISRGAVRKYQQCGNGGSGSAVPSAVALCRLADYFGVTPNFILGYPYGGTGDADAIQRATDDVCSTTGLSRETVKKLAELRALCALSAEESSCPATLDAIVSAAADEFIRLLKSKG